MARYSSSWSKDSQTCMHSVITPSAVEPFCGLYLEKVLHSKHTKSENERCQPTCGDTQECALYVQLNKGNMSLLEPSGLSNLQRTALQEMFCR